MCLSGARCNSNSDVPRSSRLSANQILYFYKFSMVANCRLENRTDFDEIRHSDATGTSMRHQQIKFCDFKIQHGGGDHFEISKNRNISAVDGPVSRKSGR